MGDRFKEMDRHILHEFGHVLGAAVHEHFSPYFPYNWDKTELEKWWTDFSTATSKRPKTK